MGYERHPIYIYIYIYQYRVNDADLHAYNAIKYTILILIIAQIYTHWYLLIRVFPLCEEIHKDTDLI